MDVPGNVLPSVEPPTVNHDDHTTKPLTPPTSEDLDLKRDATMSSELSDIDSDDGEDIEPDHYWDGGKIPVFRPTMDQFRNFQRFIEKVDKYGMKSGIVKVIPPKDWRESLPDLSEAVKSIKVKNPIHQEFAGQHGIYTQANIEKQRSYNLPEWKAVTEEAHHQPPAKRGERRRAAAADPPTRTRSTRAQASANKSESTPTPKRGPGRPRRRPLRNATKDEDEEDSSVEVPPTPKSPQMDDEKKQATKKIKVEQEDGAPARPRGRQPRGEQKQSTASRRMNNRTALADYVDEKAFKNFDYHLEHVDEFTPERCKELEENYWKTINYGSPMYGADMPGSLFEDKTTSWNVAKLPNLLDVLGTKVPGVNTAYLYLGMWKATFAWHLEDVDLYSINYIHFGAPKQWYSISQEDARRFEAAMKNIWPRDAKNCSQFLRHKTYLISPQQLEKQFNIKVNRLVHYEGEFVITYPYGYHSGYNIGYNCAESVNFANESWLSYGRIAKKCECEADSVWVDVNEIERKLRGEPTPEYYEETDSEDEEAADHLPSPPPSVAGKPKGKPGRKPGAGNKRKRSNKEPDEAAKPKKVRRIRIRIKVPGRGMPCVLCPNDVEYDELLPTDNGLKAHRICADYTPETYISQRGGVDTICNVANIGKDRLELKCNYCRSKRGAVFQCSQKKCTRAFHATCAMAAGVQVDLGPMPTFDEEGTEYFYDGYDFRCRFHRPKKRNNKAVDVDALEKDKYIMNYAKTLKPKDAVQFQYVGGEMYQIYGGTVVENRPGEQAIIVDVLPDGDRVEVEWKYLLKLDPAESQRLKPSANAKPLPEHLKETDASLDMSNRTDGVPEMGDPFQDPNAEQKWAEFNTAPDVTKKIAPVNFGKDNQLWYYLGKTSTEARPQYTENLARQVHNSKSNFLDTVRPPAPAVPTFQHRSYPATYPLKPAPVSIPPRTPTQQSRPYMYKPKEAMMSTFRSPNYNPDTRKNPNSPVAHQPNVYSYHSTNPQNKQPLYQNTYQNHRPAQQYIPYVPPQSGPPAASKSLLDSIHHYAHSPYPNNSSVPPRELQSLPYTPQGQGPTARLTYGTFAPPSQSPLPPRSGASASSMLSNPTGTNKPAIPGGGFTPEWAPKPVHTPGGHVPSPTPFVAHPNQRHGRLSFAGDLPSGVPVSRPSPQFQSVDAFQRDLAQAPRHSIGTPKWDQMFHQLNTSNRNPSSPVHPRSPAYMQPIAPRPSSVHQEAPKLSPAPVLAPAPKMSHTPPLPPPSEPQRPIPSPLSDGPKSPVSETEKTTHQMPSVHAGETWRYTQ